MDMLKKLFPLSFKYVDSVSNLVIGILVYLIAGFLIGALIRILAKIPVLGLIFGIAGGLVDIYCLAGIVIQVLVYIKVLK